MLKTKEQLTEEYIAAGKEIAPDSPADREDGRRTSSINGIHVYFTAAEETARDDEEAAWADGSAARAWVSLREERDIKLAATDWRTMPDAPTMSDAWKAYREALRDLPGTLNDTTVLETITWPTEPS